MTATMATDTTSRVCFSAMWSDRLEEAIKDRAGSEPYRLFCWPSSDDYAAFTAAIERGIDAHLEAVEFEQSTDHRGAPLFKIEPSTLHTLVRRLMEDGEDAGFDLASGICETLNIELV